MPEHPPNPPQPAGAGAGPGQGAPGQGVPGAPAAKAGNTKLFLIVGGAVAAVGAVVLVLVLVLTLQSPRYADLLPCSDAGLSGTGPTEPGALLEHHPWAPDTQLIVNCDDRAARGEGENAVLAAVLAAEGYADGDGAMEDLLDRLLGDRDSAEEERDAALGEYAVAYVAEPEDDTVRARVGAVSGNVALFCLTSADGAEEEVLERATELCSDYLDAMDADAPRA